MANPANSNPEVRFGPNGAWTLWLLCVYFSLMALAQASEPASVPPDKPPLAGATAVETQVPPDQDDQGTADAKEWDLDSFIDAYQPYAKNISFYRPIYFLVGIDPQYSKFQVSFKYRFFHPQKQAAKRFDWMKGLHFGYTQTSFWDLASDSAPFEDTSYKPDLFYRSHNIDTGIGALKGCFVQTGFQHESNGRGGEESRSTNYLYLEPSFIFMNPSNQTGLKITPRIWAYVRNDDTTNADLYRYRGYFDLQLTVGKANSFVVDSSFRWAHEGPSIQIDLTYPLHQLFSSSIELYFQAQYVNALAESLINYRERTEAVRLGFAIVR